MLNCNPAPSGVNKATSIVQFTGLSFFVVTYVITGDADEGLLIFNCHATDAEHAISQAVNAHPDAVILTAALLNDRYADAIMQDPSQYDAVEIHGVRDLKPSDDSIGTVCEVDEDDPEFFSVYVHLVAGGLECIGDFGNRKLAVDYAADIDKKYFKRSTRLN